MKYIIMGFLQIRLKELGLDVIDALILRYFVDFKDSKAMTSMLVEGKSYYWVKYEGVLKELPILNMKKYTLQSRFFKLRDAGVLSHHVKKEGGTFSYFSLGENYDSLIYSGEALDLSSKGEEEGKVNHVLESVDLKSYPVEENKEGCGFKSTTNNPSTKDSSSITKVLFPEEEGEAGDKLVKEVLSYLNEKTGKNFKTSTKATLRFIKAREKEGFRLSDFKAVIDNMTFLWKGTKFQRYLAPSTLFGNKFETYLYSSALGQQKSGEEERQGGASRSEFQQRKSLVPKRGNVGTGEVSRGEIQFSLKEDM